MDKKIYIKIEDRDGVQLSVKDHVVPETTQDVVPGRFMNMHDEHELDLDVIALILPLRMGFQFLGFWHPRYVPKTLRLMHYLFFLSLVIWFTIWKIHFITVEYNAGVGILRGFDTFMFLLLWIFLPFVIYKRGRPFVNGIQYVSDLKKHKKIALIYGFVYFVLLIPQLSYSILISQEIVIRRIVPVLPWASPESEIIDTILLTIGMILSVICVNTTLLFLAIAAHLQSFQINDFLDNNLMKRGHVRINNVKQILHLTIQSLKDGNESLEVVNGTLVVGFMIAIIEVGGRIVNQQLWDVSSLIPLILLLVQIYFFLFPPAYISHCWDNVFHQCLELHALALNPEDELGPIVLYMSHAYAGYHITNVRVDTNKIFYFTYIVIALLAVKAQNDVDFWMFR